MTNHENKETDTATDVVTAANRLTESKKVGPGSSEHELLMLGLLDQLHQPGGLEALLKVTKDKQEMRVRILNDETTCIREVILEIPINPGSYETPLGIITLNEVDLNPKTKPLQRKLDSDCDIYGRKRICLEGIPGSSGRVELDLSQSILATGNPRTIEIHRKGIGCQQLSPGTRLWVDVGSRLEEPTGYERPTSREIPINRP